MGDLTGGVTIQPVLGLPEPLSPTENGVLAADRQLRWKAAAGQQPSMHQILILNSGVAGEGDDVRWNFFIDGTRTKVPIPRVPDAVENTGLDVTPQDMVPGGFAWYHVSMLVPGFEYNNWSYLDIGLLGRRAWTENLTRFVYGE